MKPHPLWPCPNRCDLWARNFPATGKPLTNHHPTCEHVDSSLVDVWTVRIPGDETGCVCDSEEQAKEFVEAEADSHDAPLEIVKGKMHAEVLANLPEFDGF